MAGFPRGGSALILVAWVLAACGGGAPPNDVAQGVGFSDLQSFQMRQAALRGNWAPIRTTTTVTSPIDPISPALPPRPASASAPVAPPVAPAVTVARAPAPAPTPTPPATPTPDVASVAAAAIAALDATPQPAAPAPPVTLASAPPPVSVANPGISDEQEFDAVAGRETIESDAARLARMQAERVVIAPTAIPERPDGLGPNIIDYALATSHPVGERRYTRRPIGEERHQRACIAFRSADLAQEWFLQNGGPGRDRQGLDPDGDGYACGWNPGVFRAAAAAARN